MSGRAPPPMVDPAVGLALPYHADRYYLRFHKSQLSSSRSSSPISPCEGQSSRRCLDCPEPYGCSNRWGLSSSYISASKISFVTIVVIVPRTTGGTSLGILPTLNFAPLSPNLRLRSFSSSLRSHKRIFVVKYFKHIVVVFPGGCGKRGRIVVVPRTASIVSVRISYHLPHFHVSLSSVLGLRPASLSMMARGRS